LDKIEGPFIILRMSGNSPYILDLGYERTQDRTCFTLGRHRDSGLRFADSNVSNHHARVILKIDQWLLEDLDSTNGTFVNDRQIPPGGQVLLEEGSIFSLADVVEIEFFSASRFHEELDSRVKNLRDSRRTSNRRYSTMKRATQRQRPAPKRYPIKLKAFAEKYQSIELTDFLRIFPCPFLLLLSTSKFKEIELGLSTLSADQIVIQGGMSKLQFYPITSSQGSTELTLGRSPGSDMILSHQTISEAHALFAFDELLSEWTIEDLNSRNGLLLDGALIQKTTPLTDEVCIRFGTEVLAQFIKGESFWRFMQLYVLSHNLT
jgi:pSer/pThr/pTyr-binding forkhead associated (FHA) protein